MTQFMLREAYYLNTGPETMLFSGEFATSAWNLASILRPITWLKYKSKPWTILSNTDLSGSFR